MKDRRLFDRQVFGSGSFENLVNVGGGAAEKRRGSQVRTTSSRRHPRTLAACEPMAVFREIASTAKRFRVLEVDG
jgi:hypothetical protein